jgi:hypothetical protein
MSRIVEIDYWKVIPGSKERTEELVRKFAKFALKDLDAVFNFGVVQGGKHLDAVAFFFMWFSRADYEKWNDDCELNKEFQDWLAIVEDGGLQHKMSDHDVIQMRH